MLRNSTKTLILLLLALLTGGSEILSPLFLSMDDKRPTFFSENLTDIDDVEESTESEQVACLEKVTWLCNSTGFEVVCDQANHSFDWLFIHEHSARAPPLG